MSASEVQAAEATLQAAVAHARKQEKQGKLSAAEDVQGELGTGDEAGIVVGVYVTAFGDGVAGEDCQLFGAEVVLFLDAEVPDGHVQVHRGGLVDRVVVAALLPGGVYSVPLAQRGDLARRGNAA